MSDLSDIWSLLQMENPTGDRLVARPAYPETAAGLLLALDKDGRAHILVPLARADPSLDDRRSRGLSVRTLELDVQGGPDRRRYIDVTAVDVPGRDALDLIARDLRDRLNDRGAEPTAAVAAVIGLWRRFWSVPADLGLTREQEIGLFAELWFLRFWLIPRVGPAEAIRRWRGPFGSRHDFEWVGRSVEVKATTSSRGLIHRVNGIDQLQGPENGSLILFSLRAREEAGAGNTLPVLVASCSEAIGTAAEVLDAFEAAIAAAGYPAATAPGRDDLRLRIVEEHLYAVRDDFPRLTWPILGRELRGVERIDYDINLAGFEHLRIAADGVDVHLT
ncbi:MAG TPA: PD-(D/E)XK motif protein [Thermoanaerobaculia bacterium]